METKKTSKGLSQDRSKVAGGQEYEVAYETKKTGKTGKTVKSAVKKVGNSRTAVEKSLKDSKSKK
jgi:hypothetical protein